MGLERKSPQSPRIQPTEGVPKPSLSQTLRARKEKTQKGGSTPGFFGEKKEWHRTELGRRLREASPSIPGTLGGMYSRRERAKMIDELFPWERFQSHISEGEVRKRLRELRKTEYGAQTQAEKLRLRRQREYLEREFGIGGKH